MNPPMSVSKSWNEIAKLSLGDILIMGNDDQEYQTQYWDTTLEGRSKQISRRHLLCVV